MRYALHKPNDPVIRQFLIISDEFMPESTPPGFLAVLVSEEVTQEDYEIRDNKAVRIIRSED